MPFVNERIPEDIAEQWTRPKLGRYIMGNWTVDHERQMGIKWYSCNRFKAAQGYIWWKGETLDWSAHLDHKYEGNGEDITKYTIMWENIYIHFTPHLEPHRQEILQAMREGLLVCEEFHRPDIYGAPTHVSFHETMGYEGDSK